MRRCLLVLLFLFTALPASGQIGGQLEVHGFGIVETPPDGARIDVAIALVRDRADDAMEDVTERMDAVFETLGALQIGLEDARSSNIALAPTDTAATPSFGTAPRRAGFEGRATLSVWVRDLDRVGEVVDRLRGAGITEISAIEFEALDIGDAFDRARRFAIADARARAELYAGSTGATLGPVLAIVEREEPAGGGASPPSGAGPGTVSARVTVRYAISTTTN